MNKFFQLHSIFVMLLSVIITCTNAVLAMAIEDGGGHEKSTLFSLTVNGKEVFVEKFRDIHYTRFDYKGAARLEITVNRKITAYTFSPLSYCVKSMKKGNTISVVLTKPCSLVLQCDSIPEKLFVFDDVPDTCLNNVSRNDLVDVKSYHLDTTGTKTETAILQKALDDVARTHKVLLFSNGIYKSGTLKVHSNSRIHFLDGALLKASGIKDDFPTDQGSKESDHINDKANFTDNGEKMTHSRLLLIDKAENVTITGRGTIDGDGGVLRAQGRPSNLIRIRQSKNVRLEGLVLRDPAAWNTHILYSENVVMRDIKIINDRNVANTDGIDPDASKNVLIENCFAYCGDDNIAIKSTNNGGLLQNTEDITVRGCVFLTKKSSLKVGTETKAPMMKNILFEDNDVIESDRGMALYCEDGAQLEHIRFINNRFEKNYPDGGQKEIHFAISRRSNAGSAGRINDILIKDCSFAYPFSRSSMIEGLDAEHKISQLVIDNLCIAGKKRMSLDEAEMTTNAFVDDIIFK